MHLIKKSRLILQEGKSDKVYEVDLCELSNSNENRYLVNFRYGRRGSSLREGTKTPEPVALAKAEQLFDSVVVSKINKGYWDSEQPKPDAPPSPPVVSPSSVNDSPDRLIRTLIESLRAEEKTNRRSRLIWRLGELSYQSSNPAAVVIASYVGKGHWLEDYAIAWALGRMRALSYASTLESLKNHKEDKVARIAHESLLLISSQSQREALLADDWQYFPEAFKIAVMASDEAGVKQQLDAAFATGQSDKNINDLLIRCYQLALAYPVLHRCLLGQLADLPLVPGYFRGIRAIYKAAELRCDGPVFGLLAQRIETTPAFFRYDWGWAWVPGVGSVSPEKELKKADSRLAFSHRTKDYFRRRNWRVLKRMGQAGDLRYVDMATELLLAIKDEHGVEPRDSEVYRWESTGRRWQRHLVSRNHYGAFAGFLALNHILFEHDPAQQLAPSRRAWLELETPEGGSNAPAENFPALWRQKPENLLRLLKQSRCALVHPFACRVLDELPEFCQSISAQDLAVLLKSPYSTTCEFSLNLAKARIQNGLLDRDLLVALLSSELDLARALGVEVLASFKVAGDIDLSAALLLITYEDVHGPIVAAVCQQHIGNNEAELLLQKIVEQFCAHSSLLNEAHTLRLVAFAQTKLSEAVKYFPLTLLQRLLQHESLPVQLLGAKLLVDNRVHYGEIPDNLLQAIYHSEFASVRSVGAELLGKQSDSELLKQLPLLIDLYYQGDDQERAALLAIFSRLMNNALHQSGNVANALLVLSFKAEAQPGQHEELISFFQKNGQSVLANLDQNMLWRLLQAQSNCAQQLGAMALVGRPAGSFSVKQWALLSKHKALAVREFAFQAYEQHANKIKQCTRDALRILDNDWDDARAFGFNFFRKHYQQQEWKPEIVIFLCDNVREDVQSFGREILQAFFNADRGEEYLLKLSQHPTNNVQLFVSNFLEEYASGNTQNILQLQTYY